MTQHDPTNMTDCMPPSRAHRFANHEMLYSPYRGSNVARSLQSLHDCLRKRIFDNYRKFYAIHRYMPNPSALVHTCVSALSNAVKQFGVFSGDFVLQPYALPDGFAI